MNWITIPEGDKGIAHDSDNLRAILSVGTTLYTRHIEWFLKHREMVLKQLVVLITAELAIQKFVVEPGTYSSPARLLLLMLAGLSLILAHSGVRSCKQAFRAAMENILLVNKIMWAMCPSGKVFCDHKVDDRDIPACEDETLQVPRFLVHAIKAATTQEFVEDNLSIRKGFLRELKWIMYRKREKPANTHFWTVVLIWSLGTIGFAIGVLWFFSGIWG